MEITYFSFSAKGVDQRSCFGVTACLAQGLQPMRSFMNRKGNLPFSDSGNAVTKQRYPIFFLFSFEISCIFHQENETNLS